MDGHKQRQALTAAERALGLLGQGDPIGARRASRRAAELDQIGLFGEFAGGVDAAAVDLETDGFVSTASWDRLIEVVGPGPLAGLIAEMRPAG